MSVDQVVHESEPNARVQRLFASSRRGVSLKQGLLNRFQNAGTGISNGNSGAGGIGRIFRCGMDADSNGAALGRVLQRVLDQVRHDLVDRVSICHESGGWIHLARQTDPPAGWPVPETDP
jgi:hypothetical protein